MVSKLALLQVCAKSSMCCSIEDTETNWILTSCATGDSTMLEELYHQCLEKEAQLVLEASVAPLRELLYKKAFEPVAHRE